MRTQIWRLGLSWTAAALVLLLATAPQAITPTPPKKKTGLLVLTTLTAALYLVGNATGLPQHKVNSGHTKNPKPELAHVLEIGPRARNLLDWYTRLGASPLQIPRPAALEFKVQFPGQPGPVTRPPVWLRIWGDLGRQNSIRSALRSADGTLVPGAQLSLADGNELARTPFLNHEVEIDKTDRKILNKRQISAWRLSRETDAKRVMVVIPARYRQPQPQRKLTTQKR